MKNFGQFWHFLIILKIFLEILEQFKNLIKNLLNPLYSFGFSCKHYAHVFTCTIYEYISMTIIKRLRVDVSNWKYHFFFFNFSINSKALQVSNGRVGEGSKMSSWWLHWPPPRWLRPCSHLIVKNEIADNLEAYLLWLLIDSFEGHLC